VADEVFTSDAVVPRRVVAHPFPARTDLGAVRGTWLACGVEHVEVEIVDYRRRRCAMSTVVELPPIHPGEVLVQGSLSPLGLSRHRLAIAFGVPRRRINETVHGNRRISADTALRLSRYFGTSEAFGVRPSTRPDQAPAHLQAGVERNPADGR